MINLSLKQAIIAIVLITALLVALVGGILKIDAARNMPATPHSTHTLAWYCPPPPTAC